MRRREAANVLLLGLMLTGAPAHAFGPASDYASGDDDGWIDGDEIGVG